MNDRPILQPKRLTNDEFMHRASPFRLFVNGLKGHIGVHWHEFFELAFVLSGEGRQVLNGNGSPLARGTLFLLTPADIHELYGVSEAPCLHYNLIFSDEAMSEELRRLLFMHVNGARVCQIPECEFERIRSEFERIGTELEDIKRIGASLVVRGAIERLLVELIRRTGGTAGPGPERVSQQEDAVRRAIAHMQIHFREPLTLERAAGIANLSPNYFSRCFRDFTGVTFQRHLQTLRLSFARSLLAGSALPITDICYASGFNTLPHFERAFKSAFGLPPRLYRKGHRKDLPAT